MEPENSGQNLIIAEPSSMLDICSQKEINHYLKIGIKICQKLVFCEKLVTIKSQTHYLTFRDERFMCFLKVTVDYDKCSMSRISVSPAFRVKHSLHRSLILWQAGKEFQQVVINEKNTIYRVEYSSGSTESTNLRIDGEVPERASAMLD